MIIKPQDPQVSTVIHPGHFFAWKMPDDPIDSDPNCETGAGGAARYKGAICECNDADVFLDTEYDIEPGNMVGPTKDGIEYLNSLDPKAKWVPGTGGTGRHGRRVPSGANGGTARGSSRWRSSIPPKRSSRGGSKSSSTTSP